MEQVDVQKLLREAGILTGTNEDTDYAVLKAFYRAVLSVLADAGLLSPERRRAAWERLAIALDNEPGLVGYQLGSRIVSIRDFSTTVPYERQ